MDKNDEAILRAIRLLTDEGVLEWVPTDDNKPAVVARTQMQIRRAAYNATVLKWEGKLGRQIRLTSNILAPEIQMLRDAFEDPLDSIRPGS